MTAAARSQIMEAPISQAAHIISTTMPDGPSALPALHLRDSSLNHISGDWDRRAYHWWFVRRGLCPSQTQHWETFGSALTRPSVLSLRSMTSPLYHSSWFATNNISVHSSKLVSKAVDFWRLKDQYSHRPSCWLLHKHGALHVKQCCNGCMVWCPSAFTSLPGLESFPLAALMAFSTCSLNHQVSQLQWFGRVMPHSSVVLNSPVLMLFQISSVTASAPPADALTCKLKTWK